jgi:hypothetical protein
MTFLVKSFCDFSSTTIDLICVAGGSDDTTGILLFFVNKERKREKKELMGIRPTTVIIYIIYTGSPVFSLAFFSIFSNSICAFSSINTGGVLMIVCSGVFVTVSCLGAALLPKRFSAADNISQNLASDDFSI